MSSDGSPAGLYELYACDVIVSVLAKKADEVPAGLAHDEDLTPAFALSHALALLSARSPVLVRRFLGILYQAVPFAVPSTASLASEGSPQQSVSSDRVSQLMSVYAAFMQVRTTGFVFGRNRPTLMPSLFVVGFKASLSPHWLRLFVVGFKASFIARL
jgi:hypothetical protein